MSPELTSKKLSEIFKDAVVSSAADSSHPCVVVAAERWLEVATYLRDDMGFNMLRCLTALDMLEDNRFAIVYDLHAMQASDEPTGLWTLAAEFAIRVEVDRDAAEVPSVAALWPAADWHEREAYDMMGIRFTDHPDAVTDHDGTHPRRILCPDDWVGYPLRKDYLFPMEYHGIPATTEFELTSPRH
jgi:NADH-quinone oxidoreductase subunit C